MAKMRVDRYAISTRLEIAVKSRFFDMGGRGAKVVRQGPSVFFHSEKVKALEFVGAYVKGWQDAWILARPCWLNRWRPCARICVRRTPGVSDPGLTRQLKQATVATIRVNSVNVDVGDAVWDVEITRDPEDHDIITGVTCRSGTVSRTFEFDDYLHSDEMARDAAQYMRAGRVTVKTTDLVALILEFTT